MFKLAAILASGFCRGLRWGPCYANSKEKSSQKGPQKISFLSSVCNEFCDRSSLLRQEKEAWKSLN